MIDLPRGTASWVLSAHLLTILSPLVVIWAVVRWRSSLEPVTAFPNLFIAAAALQILGSTVESAQNNRDNWYLTANDRTLLDGCFNSCIVASLACTALACQGQRAWLWPLCLCATLAYPWMYWKAMPKEWMQALLGLVSTAALYLSFRDPVVVLPLLSVFLTLYFLGILLVTRAQSLHGFTTVVNAVGLMAIPWAMFNAASGEVLSWLPVLGGIVLVCALALVLRPRLLKMSATPHGR